MNIRSLSIAMVLIAAVLWGFIGVFVRVLSDAGMDTMQINGIRSLMCTILLAIVLLICNRSLFRIQIKDIWLFAIAALMKLAMDICYVQAQIVLSLSLAAVLLSTDCYFILIVSYFMFKGDIQVRGCLIQ